MKAKISILEKAIFSNPRHKWKIEELTQIVDVTPAHLQKLFKVEIGISPIHFIKQIRLEKARELLETTFLQVKQIGFTVGINDLSYFNREFKKKYGLPPNQYREQHYKKLEAEEEKSQ